MLDGRMLFLLRNNWVYLRYTHKYACVHYAVRSSTLQVCYPTLTLGAPYRITEIVACTHSLLHALCLPAHARAPATRSSIKRVGLPEPRKGS